jgi:hypothetical protein
MGRSCRPFGEQIRFACAACCWLSGRTNRRRHLRNAILRVLETGCQRRGFAGGLRDPPHPAATAIALHCGGVNALPCGARGRT